MTDNTSKNIDLATTNTDTPLLALRAKAAAKALGISERLLWSKTNCGEIPHIRINTAVRYPVHLLKEYLTKNATGGGMK